MSVVNRVWVYCTEPKGYSRTFDLQKRFYLAREDKLKGSYFICGAPTKIEYRRDRFKEIKDLKVINFLELLYGIK